MPFGKRQSGVAAAAQAFDAGPALAPRPAVAETGAAPAAGSPVRWFIAVLAFGGLLYATFANYGADVVRDHRLAGSWQPAYDLRAVEGKCSRMYFVATFCSARIVSVARPDQAAVTHRFFMLFSGGGGEALVPVRSTADRAAVSIFYAAETKLWNRTLSLVFAAGLLTLLAFGALLGFLNAARS